MLVGTDQVERTEILQRIDQLLTILVILSEDLHILLKDLKYLAFGHNNLSGLIEDALEEEQNVEDEPRCFDCEAPFCEVCGLDLEKQEEAEKEWEDFFEWYEEEYAEWAHPQYDQTIYDEEEMEEAENWRKPFEEDEAS